MIHPVVRWDEIENEQADIGEQTCDANVQRLPIKSVSFIGCDRKAYFQDQSHQDREEQIRKRSSQRNQKIVSPWVLKLAGVDENRLSLPKSRHKQEDRPQGIDVFKWIERQPPRLLCRIIAEPESGERAYSQTVSPNMIPGEARSIDPISRSCIGAASRRTVVLETKVT